MKIQVANIALLFSIFAVAQAETVFNSTNEFSTVQGQEGWYYGYYDGDVTASYTPDDFEEFPQHGPTSWIINRSDRSGYWTSLYAVGGHPNGPVANYYQGTEHWTVRRWISDVSGTILIEGFIRKSNGSSGDGITAHIFLNQTEVFSELRPGNDPLGVEYAMEVNVQVGDILDFAISPNNYDMYDSTKFTAIGTLAYELEEPVIAFGQELNDKGCVEATSTTGTPVMVYVENAADNTNVVYIWSTSDGLIGQGPEFTFDAPFNSNLVVFLTAQYDLTGEMKSTYQVVRACDSTAPDITIEKRAKHVHLRKPLDLDINVIDALDGVITDYAVCIGKTLNVKADEFTGAASVEVPNPLVAAQWKTTDVTVIASDSSGNTAIETIQVKHQNASPKKKREPEKKASSGWSWWRNR